MFSSLPPTQVINILIIDTDTVARAKLIKLLRVMPFGPRFRIHETTKADIAITVMKTNAFDCVFLTHAPPQLDGIQILKSLYEPITGLIKSPLIVLATQDRESAILDALRNGAQDYLLKETISDSTLQIAMTKARESFELKRSRQRAEDELSHVRKMEAVGRLTSGVAHDFNNLLTVVIGNIHLLRRRFLAGIEKYDPQDILAKVDAIETVSTKGAELVRRLMIFTRQSPLAQEVVDLNACISETFELLKRTLGEAIEIDMILSKDSWKGYLDPSEFENILINFAVNARDAMPRGGKLTIETENVILDEHYALSYPNVIPGPYIMIAVSDNGTGMPPEVLKNVFEPFFTTKPPGEGTGLGMSMAYGFIKQCSGHVHVYSEIGRGTVFRAYLPRFMTEDDTMQPPEENKAMPMGRETILVAEDDDDVRAVAVSMLERLEYKVLQAKDGRSALEILKRDHRSIDLLFTDVVMPGEINGVQLAQQMREYYPQVKVLFTSGYTENAIPDYEFCASEELISKPYRREVLAMKLRKLLDGEKNEPGQKACVGY